MATRGGTTGGTTGGTDAATDSGRSRRTRLAGAQAFGPARVPGRAPELGDPPGFWI